MNSLMSASYLCFFCFVLFLVFFLSIIQNSQFALNFWIIISDILKVTALSFFPHRFLSGLNLNPCLFQGSSVNIQVSVQGPSVQTTRGPLSLNPSHAHFLLAPLRPHPRATPRPQQSRLCQPVIDDTQEFHSGLPSVLELP